MSQNLQSRSIVSRNATNSRFSLLVQRSDVTVKPPLTSSRRHGAPAATLLWRTAVVQLYTAWCVFVFVWLNQSGVHSRKQEASGPAALLWRHGRTHLDGSVTSDNATSKCQLLFCFVFFLDLDDAAQFRLLSLLSSSCLGSVSGTQAPVKHCNSLQQWKCITIKLDVKGQDITKPPQCVRKKTPKTFASFIRSAIQMSPLWRHRVGPGFLDNQLLKGTTTWWKVKT